MGWDIWAGKEGPPCRHTEFLAEEAPFSLSKRSTSGITDLTLQEPEGKNLGLSQGRKRSPNMWPKGMNEQTITHHVHFKPKHPAAQTLFCPPKLQLDQSQMACLSCHLGCLHRLYLWDQGQIWQEPILSRVLTHLYTHKPSHGITPKTLWVGAGVLISQRRKLRLAGNN